MEMTKTLSDNYEWREKDGLYRKKDDKEEKLCNACMEVTCYKEIVNRKMGTRRRVVEGQYHYTNGKLEPFCFPVEKIQSGKFMEDLSINVLIEIEKKRAVTQVFRYSILAQITDMTLVEESECDFGWDGHTYKFEEKREDTDKSDYQYGMQIAAQIINSKGIATGFILAAIHGPLKKMLLDAGVRHDFTTCVSGETGVGKTSLARGYCRYLHKKETAFSLGSDRKELKKMIRDASDVTVLADDFNKSDSDRVTNHGKQVLAEIVQISSDSCQNLVDDKPNQISGNVHIITTVESVLTNVSTMNRCFLIHMDNKITDECWREFNDFIDNDGMWNFMRYFMAYVSKNYLKLVKSVKEDYKCYLSTKKWTEYDIGGSRERIVYTYAVQKVLLKVLIDYFRELKFDMGVVRRVNQIGSDSIHEGCQLVVDFIQEAMKTVSYTRYIPELLKILEDAIRDKRISNNEKEYLNSLDDYDLLCVNKGYMSFKPADICKKIAKRLGLEKISSKALAKELKHYGLIKVDANGTCSFLWKTKSRMFHVKGVDLLLTINPDEEQFWIDIVKGSLHPKNNERWEVSNY